MPDFFLSAGGGAAPFAFIALAALRVAAALMTTPVFQAASMPASVRVLLVAALAMLLAAGSPGSIQEWDGWGSFVAAAFAELALGATLGLGVALAFAAFCVAGQILDVQLGFGMAQIVDPVTRRPVPIVTTAFERVGVLVFLLLDGHHALLRGLQYSIDRLPVGAGWSAATGAEAILDQVGGIFSLGFALAAPVAFCTMLVEFLLGVIGRNLPQMNMFAVGFQVKIIAGLVALALWFSGIGGVMARVYASIAATWSAIFAAAGQGR